MERSGALHTVDSVKVTLRNGRKTITCKTERKIKENTVSMEQFQVKFILLFIGSVDVGRGAQAREP